MGGMVFGELHVLWHVIFFSDWISFTTGPVYGPWSTSNEMYASKYIKPGCSSTASADAFRSVISMTPFSPSLLFSILSFFLNLLLLLLPFPFTLSSIHSSPPQITSFHAHTNRGCAVEPGRRPANQHLHGNCGPQRCPHLRYPGDAASTNHLEEEWHHIKLSGPGRYKREWKFSSSVIMEMKVLLICVTVGEAGGAWVEISLHFKST